MTVTRFGWVALGLVAIASPATAAACKFAYTPQFHDHEIVPRLEEVIGAGWAAWDNPHPLIMIKRQTVTLLFDNTTPNVLDCPLVEIVIEKCGEGPVTTSLVSPFPEPPNRSNR